MFTSEHQIWKFAYAGDELDDWLPYAEDLVEEWSTEEEVVFKNTFDIILASYLLMDGLLPPSARKAFSELIFSVISESKEKKIALKSLHITPPKPGRKSDRNLEFHILRNVIEHLKQGLSKGEAYELVSLKYFKSTDTVRRMFERAVKKSPGLASTIKSLSTRGKLIFDIPADIQSDTILN